MFLKSCDRAVTTSSVFAKKRLIFLSLRANSFEIIGLIYKPVNYFSVQLRIVKLRKCLRSAETATAGVL